MVAAGNKYLYGIIKEPTPRRFDVAGVGGEMPYTVTSGSLAVVVSDSAAELDPTRRNTRAHAKVQEHVMGEYTLLPMGFGVVAHGEDEVLRLLERNREALLREIRRLDGLIEVAVRVYWNSEIDMNVLDGKHRDLSKMRTKIEKASSTAEARNLVVEAGMLVERLLEDWKEKSVGKIYAALEKVATEGAMGQTSGMKNLMNASFLLNCFSEEKFKSELYRLDGEFEGKLDFKYVAPLPPYTFLGIELELG
jgi:hypothetical protein